MPKNNVPAYRFRGYEDPWEQRKLGEIFVNNNERNNGQFTEDKTFSIAQMKFNTAGNGASQDSIKNYKVLRIGDIAFEGHTNKNFAYGRFILNDIGNGIMSPRFSALRPITHLKIEFWKQLIHLEYIMRPILVKSTKAGTMMNELVKEEFLNELILIPKEEEQKQIGTFFQKFDDTITLHQNTVEALKGIKSNLLTLMFPQEGEDTPRVRFKGYTNAWEQRKLSEIVKSIDDGDWIESKDQSDSGIRLIQTGNVGIASYLDKADRAKWISIDTFNHLKCKEVFPGDILISRLPDPAGRACIIPPLPTRAITAVDCSIVKLGKETDSQFLLQLLNSPQYFRQIDTLLAGGTRQRVSRSNLEEVRFSVPDNIEEQQQIGVFFHKLDEAIALHQRKLNKLKDIKEALLNKMFPNS